MACNHVSYLPQPCGDLRRSTSVYDRKVGGGALVGPVWGLSRLTMAPLAGVRGR